MPAVNDFNRRAIPQTRPLRVEQRQMAHNIRMHLTGHSELCPLPPTVMRDVRSTIPQVLQSNISMSRNGVIA
jgi:hypothetical protein